MTTPTENQDGLTLLTTQHEQIRSLFTSLESGAPDERQRVFEDLVRLLAVHETAEEEVVHPRLKDLGPEGERIREARLAEEKAAKEQLASLDGMKTTDTGFDVKLQQLRTAVIAHAEHEEREEFPLLRQNEQPEKLEKMATAIKAAEATAPTHPHPAVNSQAANLAAGPLASVVDRARDAIRKIAR